MTELSRRSFLGGMAAAFAATAIPSNLLLPPIDTIPAQLIISKRPDFNFMTQFVIQARIKDKVLAWAYLGKEEVITDKMLTQVEEIFYKQFRVRLKIDDLHRSTC